MSSVNGDSFFLSDLYAFYYFLLPLALAWMSTTV